MASAGPGGGSVAGRLRAAQRLPGPTRQARVVREAPACWHPGVGYEVFAQAESGQIDLAKVVKNARGFFHASVEVLGEELLPPGFSPPERSRVRLELASEQHGWRARFAIASRPANHDDHEFANAAEAASRASGMALLAERCRYVWAIEPEGDEIEQATLTLCGVLASVGLGPVMPEDHTTLFGVRGAMARLEKLEKGAYR